MPETDFQCSSRRLSGRERTWDWSMIPTKAAYPMIMLSSPASLANRRRHDGKDDQQQAAQALGDTRKDCLAILTAVAYCTKSHKYKRKIFTSRVLCGMVQKTVAEPRGRGRPRAYDPKVALLKARDAFWQTGYAATSLDDIAAATGMNRPSLYAAFGDKRALYLEALAQYWRLALAEMRDALATDVALEEALMRVYEGALSIYFSGDDQPRGCFVIGTAVTEAVEETEIRTSLMAGFQIVDSAFEERLRAAHETGELKNDADSAALAVLATATMHTIAVRARAGVSRADLRELARRAVKVICT